MHTLPDYLTTDPFFRTRELSEKAKYYKDKIDNYSTLSKSEKFVVFKELLELNFSWPDPLRQEGFWCTHNEKYYLFKTSPYPVQSQISDSEKAELTEFLAKLTKVEQKASTFAYMGYSSCRLCGMQNGNKTFYTDLFAWPEGYQHYIQKHGVKPSAAFVLHIRGLI